MKAEIFDAHACALGEGPLWHPERKQLFWFDILGKQLHTKSGDATQTWQFDEYVSAAGWVSHDELLIASETGLFTFDLTTGQRALLVPLEADNKITRSNDGRADPWGGFWIGTMGKAAEPDAGAIYRFYEGTVVPLFTGITISNAICFAPDKSCAYFCDTSQRQIMRQTLDSAGWPQGRPTVFIDLQAQGLNPDGAVVDAEGHLWSAQWGAARVARYNMHGQFQEAFTLPAAQASCPAFGGAALEAIFVTSAAVDLGGDADGLTYVFNAIGTRGQAEHRVRL